MPSAAAFPRFLAAITSRRGYIAMLAVWMPTALFADARGPRSAQTVVAVVTWAMLVLVWLGVRPTERVQLIVVVVVATTLEILFSIVWGLYIYRWGNLPLYVPPGHGLIYLLAVRLAATPVGRHRRAPLVVLALATAWTAVGQVAWAQPDRVGLVLLPVVGYFILRGSRPGVYVGAFIATSMLEILGTGFGNWAWQAHVPGVGIGQANPPSAIAGGYCLLDAVVLVLCAQIIPALARRRPAVLAEPVGD